MGITWVPAGGWVIVSYYPTHPSFPNGLGWVISGTFRTYRKDCIADFVSGFGHGCTTWRQVKSHGYRCVHGAIIVHENQKVAK